MSIQEKIMIPARLIDTDKINDSPGPYCMSFGFDPGLYIHSINEIGLVNTPLLIKNTDGEIDVISGYRRIQAIKALKWNKIPCRILPESTLSALECLLLNLHDNLATRKFNIVEKSMLLNRLVEHFEKRPVLGTSPGEYLKQINMSFSLAMILDNGRAVCSSHNVADAESP